MGVDQQVTESWQEPGTTRDVVQRLAERVRGAGGRIVEQTEDALTAQFGSRLAFRLFGAMLRAGRNRVPARIVVQVADADTGSSLCRITATASSDEGAYLVTTPLAANLYKERLPALLSRLQPA